MNAPLGRPPVSYSQGARLVLLLRMIETNKRLASAEAMARFSITERTLRRDLAALRKVLAPYSETIRFFDGYIRLKKQESLAVVTDKATRRVTDALGALKDLRDARAMHDMAARVVTSELRYGIGGISNFVDDHVEMKWCTTLVDELQLHINAFATPVLLVERKLKGPYALAVDHNRQAYVLRKENEVV